jgi:hypothetical protein
MIPQALLMSVSVEVRGDDVKRKRKNEFFFWKIRGGADNEKASSVQLPTKKPDTLLRVYSVNLLGFGIKYKCFIIQRI